MNIFICALFFAAGMAVDAFYNRRKQFAESDAYTRGYSNAKNEEQYYKNGVNEGRFQEMLRHPVAPPAPRHANANIPESFMDEARKNGHATMKIQ